MARGEVTGRKPMQTADPSKRQPGPPIADPGAVEPTAHIAAQRSARATKPPAADAIKRKPGPPIADPGAVEPTAHIEPQRSARATKPPAADAIKRKPGPPIADPGAVEPTAHIEPQRSTRATKPPIRGPPLAMSIREFCTAHRISDDKFIK